MKERVDFDAHKTVKRRTELNSPRKTARPLFRCEETRQGFCSRQIQSQQRLANRRVLAWNSRGQDADSRAKRLHQEEGNR
jgi:hypothetical protein